MLGRMPQPFDDPTMTMQGRKPGRCGDGAGMVQGWGRDGAGMVQGDLHGAPRRTLRSSHRQSSLTARTHHPARCMQYGFLQTEIQHENGPACP